MSEVRIRFVAALFVLVPCGPLFSQPGGAFVEAYRRAERAEARGDAKLAIELWARALETLETLEARPGREQSVDPEVEVVVRRLYALGSEAGDFTGVAKTLARWADGKEGAAAVAPGTAAVARFYAGASRLYVGGDLEAAQAIWEPLGFLSDWWIVGPFDNERGGGFKVAYGAEKDRRPAAGVEHDGKNRKVAWRDLPVRPVTGWVDLDALMEPNDQALAYALTFVKAEADVEALLHVSSDEGFRAWVNGELVGSSDVHRLMRFDQTSLPIRLRGGWNAILVKVAEDQGRWEFRCRLSARDGSTLSGWSEAEPPAEAELPPAPSEVDGGAAPDEALAPPSIATIQRRLAATENASAGNSSAEWNNELLGILHQERNAHDFNEHPDREAFRRAIQLAGKSASGGLWHRFARSNKRERGITADRDDNAWREALEKAAEADPPSVIAMLDLAEHVLESFNALNRAAKLVERALELNPRSVRAHLVEGEIARKRGFPHARKRAIEACRALGLESPERTRAEASELRNAGKLEEAEKLLRDALAKNWLDGGAHGALVDLLLDTDRVDAAVEQLEAQLRSRPFDLESRSRLVDIYDGRGELERALKAQQALVAIAPDSPEARRREGELLARLGRTDEAREAWTRAFTARPNYPELREYLEFLEQRRDPFVEEHRRDLTAIIEANRSREVDGDDPAEWILDHYVVRVNPDGTSKEFKQLLVRILNDRGARLFDRYSEHYARGEQELEFKFVRVIHPDGSEERARLRSGSGGRRGARTYANASVDVPPLEPGDMVEIQFVRETTRQSFFGDYFGHREYFQGNYPIREKTFVLRAPAERELYFHQRGMNAVPEVVTDDESGTKTYTWTVRDIAKIKPEPGMPPAYENLPALEISTFENWKAFSSWYENLVRKQFTTSPEIRRKVQELVSGKTTAEEKISALYDFVVQEVRYNMWEFGVHGFKPYNAPAIFARRFGDCKDKATLLTVMLGEADIPAHPVLIRMDESRGREDLTLPMVNHFNHCITYVPAGVGPRGEKYPAMFLDGTATYNAADELPSADRGANVLVVAPGDGKVETIPWNRPDEITSTETVDVAVADDLGATLTIHVRARGDFGSAIRRYFDVPGQRLERLERIYGARYPNVEVLEQSFSELGDLEVPVECTIKIHVPDFVQPAAEGLKLRTLDDFFRVQQSYSELASLAERESDLVVGFPRRLVLRVDYSLPERFAIKVIPEGAVVESRFGRLTAAYRRGEAEAESSRSRVIFERTLELTAPRVGPEDYAVFRELVESLERLGERFVIVEQKAVEKRGAGKGEKENQ